MKFTFQRRFAAGLALCAGLIMAEGNVAGQDAGIPAVSGEAAVQQSGQNIRTERSANLQQQDQKPSGEKKELKNSQQRKEIKKVQSSSPDLTRKRGGARPPSISRPSGSGMPKGAGKPAGVTRPGRR